MTNFKVGQRVMVTTDIEDDGADGHHPAGYFAYKGEEVIVRKVGAGNFPVYVSHETITDNSFGVTVDEIELVEEEIHNA